MIRKLIHQWFPVVLNITFVISILVVISIGLGIMNSTDIFGNSMASTGFLTMVAGVTGVILMYGGIYTLLDIRDALEKRNQ